MEGLLAAFTVNLGKAHRFYLPEKETRILYPPSSFLGALERVPGFGCVCTED